jgi:transcriptional regulator with XRE-family HTH domain
MQIDVFLSSAYVIGMDENELLSSNRRAAGIKQRDLAAAIGISPQYLSDLENGRREVPGPLLAKLPQPIRAPIVRARIAELEKLL